MERTTVRLPDELLELAKEHARRTGRTFTQLLEQAVRSELAGRTPGARVAEHSGAYVARVYEADDNSSNTLQPLPTVAQRERSAKQLLEQVRELQDFLQQLPDLDQRSADDILGYNASGLPE